MTVDIYTLGLDTNSTQQRLARELLSEDECARFERKISPWRERDIMARATLRILLGKRLGVPPWALVFAAGAKGKPELALPRDTDIHFSLAHSVDLAIIALGMGAPLGVDLEQFRDETDHEMLADEILSRRELEQYRKMSPERRQQAFFQAWTCKEAFVKATGEGLSRGLSSVEISLESRGEPRLMGVPPAWAESTWTLMSLPAPQGFAAALVAGGAKVTLRLHEVRNRFADGGKRRVCADSTTLEELYV